MKSHVLLVIPLLDSRMIASYKINRVVVVDVSYDTQLRRVLSRDGVDVSLANSMIYTQATRKERLDLATDVLVNNGLIEDLYFSCDKLSEILLLR
jgi:dephospho-CoA kinase